MGSQVVEPSQRFDKGYFRAVRQLSVLFDRWTVARTGEDNLEATLVLSTLLHELGWNHQAIERQRARQA